MNLGDRPPGLVLPCVGGGCSMACQPSRAKWVSSWHIGHTIRPP